jgi:release factor glutamine methyltransferase
MNQAEFRQHFYAQLSPHYRQGELQSIYHWCVEEIEGWNRIQAYSKNDELVTESTQAAWDSTIERLKKHEPIQYIFNKASFFDLQLHVDDSVLIPRPETEELVEILLQTESDKSLNILDIGTGSGCIALALKSRNENWNIRGCDVSEKALSVAKKNASRLNLSVDFFHADASQSIDLNLIDVIVSNPPYIPSKLGSSLDKNVLNHEPHTALFSPENDAFFFFRKIAEMAEKSNVKRIYMETHATEISQLESELKRVWSGRIRFQNDLSSKPRFIVLSRN